MKLWSFRSPYEIQTVKQLLDEIDTVFPFSLWDSGISVWWILWVVKVSVLLMRFKLYLRVGSKAAGIVSVLLMRFGDWAWGGRQSSQSSFRSPYEIRDKGDVGCREGVESFRSPYEILSFQGHTRTTWRRSFRSPYEILGRRHLSCDCSDRFPFSLWDSESYLIELSTL